MNALRIAASALVALAASQAHARGYLEIPEPNAPQAGIGVVAGWHCTAQRVEVQIDEKPPLLAASGTARGDTASVCGRSDTGFAVIVNWNELPIDCFGCANHRVRAYADGVLFADVRFPVTHFRETYLAGKAATYRLRNFPDIGRTAWVKWDEAKQNFTLELATNPKFVDSVSGIVYHGALFRGPQNPACGPYSTAPRTPRYGAFRVDLAGEGAQATMTFTANYADGGVCQLTNGAREPYGAKIDDGFIVGTFESNILSQCPEYPQGLRVRVDGERLVADSTDACSTAHVMAISK